MKANIRTGNIIGGFASGLHGVANGSRHLWRVRWVFLLLVCLGSLAGAPATQTTYSLPPPLRSVTLTISRVSGDANGRLVVSMDAAGDLPGALTLIIDRASNNTIRGGHWALVVAHAQYSGELEEDGDAPNMTLVNQGTLWG